MATVIVKRLANVKTRRETGLDYVVSAMNVLTPFGSKQKFFKYFNIKFKFSQSKCVKLFDNM